ncbi:MAG TPA: HD domain-containing phosphohydrolase [Acidimicrobiia bacterium]|nr:HD domain-containing phosphohydrolase [Acidimicrobiia bacterium]
MNTRDRVGVAGAGSIVASVTVRIAQPHSTAAGAILLAAGVVLGELLLLRLGDGTGLPLSYAVLVVIVTCFPPLAVVALVLGAELVAVVVREEPRALASRVAIGVWRVLVAAGALGAFRVARHLFGARAHLGAVLGALVVTVVAALLVDELLRFVTHRHSGLVGSGNVAWTALGSCTVLMAIGYSGVNGRGDLGVWGPLLFSIPLLATWYSFDRLASINRTYRQTIEALAMAPELGGLVPDGHAERVTELATAIGRELDLDDAHLQTLETAARLHHIGQVTLDEPAPGTRADAGEVAAVTAALMRGIEPLQSAAEIVAGEPRGARETRGSNAPVAIASQTLKVASAFDDLTGGDADRSGAALEALYSSPGYVYNLRALEALERLLDRRHRAARA